jgi:hypothetical protein
MKAILLALVTAVTVGGSALALNPGSGNVNAAPLAASECGTCVCVPCPMPCPPECEVVCCGSSQ